MSEPGRKTHISAICFQRPYAMQWPRTSSEPHEHFCSSSAARAKALLLALAHLCTKMQAPGSKKAAGVSMMRNHTAPGFSSLISCPGGRGNSLLIRCFPEPNEPHLHNSRTGGSAPPWMGSCLAADGREDTVGTPWQRDREGRHGPAITSAFGTASWEDFKCSVWENFVVLMPK